MTATAGFSQLFGKRTTGEIYASASRARYDDGFGIRHFTLVSLIGRGSYDRRDNPLDASRGYYLSGEAIPFYEFDLRQRARSAARSRGASTRASATADKVVLAGLARGRQLRRPRASSRARPTCCSSPAAAARSAATPTVDRRREHPGARRGAVRGRRQGPARGFGRAALPDQPELGRGRLRRLGHRHRRTRPGAARATGAPASASACATTPASASCAATSRRRSTRAPATRASRSTSASGRRFETVRRPLRAARARRHRARWRRTRPTPDSDNGFLLNLLQNKLSAPGRQIRLSGVSGALSSQARIARITISDDKGPWLQVDNAELDWNRLALLRGRVDVDAPQPPAASPGCAAPRRPPPQRNLPHRRGAALLAARAAGLDPGAAARHPDPELRPRDLRPGRRVQRHRQPQPRRRRPRLRPRRQAARRPRRRARAQGRLLQPDPQARRRTSPCRSRRAASSRRS